MTDNNDQIEEPSAPWSVNESNDFTAVNRHIDWESERVNQLLRARHASIWKRWGMVAIRFAAAIAIVLLAWGLSQWLANAGHASAKSATSSGVTGNSPALAVVGAQTSQPKPTGSGGFLGGAIGVVGGFSGGSGGGQSGDAKTQSSAGNGGGDDNADQGSTRGNDNGAPNFSSSNVDMPSTENQLSADQLPKPQVSDNRNDKPASEREQANVSSRSDDIAGSSAADGRDVLQSVEETGNQSDQQRKAKEQLDEMADAEANILKQLAQADEAIQDERASRRPYAQASTDQFAPTAEQPKPNQISEVSDDLKPVYQQSDVSGGDDARVTTKFTVFKSVSVRKKGRVITGKRYSPNDLDTPVSQYCYLEPRSSETSREIIMLAKISDGGDFDYLVKTSSENYILAKRHCRFRLG
jgi:hypothetical protein